jgi:hypothetical protein
LLCGAAAPSGSNEVIPSPTVQRCNTSITQP